MATSHYEVATLLYRNDDSWVDTDMKITNIRWSEVRVTYSEPVPADWPEEKKVNGDLYTNSHVIYRDDVKSLQIVEYDDTNWSTGRDILLAKARLIKLDFNSAVFEACWWRSTMDSESYDELIPCKVECSF